MAAPVPTEAFVPGHITGLFTVNRDEDPLRTGSRGAGVTLVDGATVEVGPAGSSGIRIDGNRMEIEAVRSVLESLDVAAEIDIETELPLGTGFGLSGAMALGTALAANEAFELGHSENDLIRIAHRAEVEAGTGLGDVIAQARGGLPLRLEPGAPPHGQLDGIPARKRVEYLSLGELSTPTILKERREVITAAGTETLAFLREHPTADRFMAASRQFADAVELLTPELETIIETVEEAGGQASMAMLGKTVFAFGRDLSDAGYDPEVSATHPSGARLLE